MTTFLQIWRIMTTGLALLIAATCLPVAASAQNAQPVQENAYRINAGDELEVYVWGEARLQRNVKVLPDGTFALPLAGQMKAEGLLPAELEVEVAKRLSGQFRDQVPQVTVSVVSPSGLQFSVLGKVGTPGSFTPGRYVNVMEALSMAGGPTEFADLNDVLIIREADGDLKGFRVKLASLFKGGTSASTVSKTAIPRVQSGDTIVVP